MRALLLCIMAMLGDTFGFRFDTVQPRCSRRALVASSPWLLLPLCASASTRETLLGTGSDTRCENGEGEACTDLAEGNEYIRKLQERSKANKAANEKKLYDKTVRQLGYSDFFDGMDLYLVQKSDGKYATLTAEQYSAAKKAGKIEQGNVDLLKD